MAFPVAKVTLPADLVPHSKGPSGQLPDNLLIKPGWPLRPDARMHRQAARAFLQLANDIKARFGETITCTSTADCYRSYGIQESTFKQRYSATPLAGRKTKTWNGRTYWQKPNTAMAGVPGTSNHGWGLAMDTALVRDGKVVGILANRAMFDWLLANAKNYGISWEAQSEPWHLRYHAGDSGLPHGAPGAAPAAAAPPPPAPEPEPEPEDQEMTYYVQYEPTGHFWVSNGVTKVQVPDGDTLNQVSEIVKAYGPKPIAWHKVLGGQDHLMKAFGQVLPGSWTSGGLDQWGIPVPK